MASAPVAGIRRLPQTPVMRDYAEVDPVIDAWAQATVERLFTEWAGEPDRFAYLPGLRPFECFQIAIEPPLAGRITVLAWSVETDDGSEFEQRWDGEIDTLSTMLDAATKTVREWVNRSQSNAS